MTDAINVAWETFLTETVAADEEDRRPPGDYSAEGEREPVRGEVRPRRRTCWWQMDRRTEMARYQKR